MNILVPQLVLQRHLYSKLELGEEAVCSSTRTVAGIDRIVSEYSFCSKKLGYNVIAKLLRLSE